MLLRNNTKQIKSLIDNNNILTSKEECYCYATDASNMKEHVKAPDLVTFAESVEDVQKIVKFANQHQIPVISRGAGTNMVGACLCPKGGIVLNFSKMNKIIDINPVNMTATVQPGVILGDLKAAVEEFGLFFPPDPSNYKVSTIGGAIAQSSGGARSYKYGTTKDYILSLKVVTAKGELMTIGAETIKDSAGYHLAQLIVGSEGTLAIVVEATLKLIPKPEASSLLTAYFDDIDSAVNSIEEFNKLGIYPSAIDIMDKNALITVSKYKPNILKTNYEYMLLIELDGSKDAIKNDKTKAVNALMSSFASEIIVPETDEEIKDIWDARHSSFAASARLAPDVISDDLIVPRNKISKLVNKISELCAKYSLKMCLIGHIGDGNLHPQIVLNTENKKEYQDYLEAKSQMYKTAIEMGGTISAEHGIGFEKLPYFNKTVDNTAYEYMKMIKRLFDPNNILNPGKIFEI